METIGEVVRKAETNYQSGITQIGEYVEFSLRDTVEKVTAYVNSRHTSGSTDSLGREKPFFNIVTAAVNVWYRATDIDRKDIVIKPENLAQTVPAFLATVHLQEWMKRERFGVFLNQWGRTLSQYGSAVVKFIENEGQLNATVIPWNRLIVDAIDFTALPTIEKIYMTPAQLRKFKQYDQDAVEDLITSLTTRKNLRGQVKDNKSEFIELYEVHGELPVALLKDIDDRKEEDWKTYRQQMHVVSFSKNRQGKYDDFTLYRGKEGKHPYMITHLIEEDGRSLAIGAVEYLFDAQWMQNHTMKNMKDTLDLASKLIFQTSDGNYVNRNVLSAIETGDILIHKINEPLTQVNNSKTDIVALQNFSTQWKVLAQEITSTPDSIRGNTLPSGTPYALGGLLTQNANSLFELMTENKGLAIEDMLRIYIIPHLKKQLDNKDEIIATLEAHDIKKIDSMYVPREAIRRHNAQAKESILSGVPAQPFNQAEMQGQVQQELANQGNQRSFTPEELDWTDVFKDLEWKVDVAVTNESSDKQAMLTSLSSALQTVASLAGRPMTPTEQLIFNKIMAETGTSPLELSQLAQPQQQMTPATPNGQVGAGLPVK